MSRALLFVLGLFFLNPVPCSHAQETEPQPTLSADSSIRPPGGAVTLTCSVQDSDDWRYVLHREISSSTYYYKDFTGPSVQVSEGGVYYCRGVRGNPVIYTGWSNKFTVLKPAPVLTFEPSWSQIFTGERVEFTCSIQGSRVSRWTYEWIPATLNSAPVYSSQSRTITATEPDSGDYSCRGRKDPDLVTEWSNIITLTVSRHRPKAQLSAESRDLPVGGSVTLTCSVEPPSSGWRFFWFRGDKNSELLKTPVSDGPISVSEGGVYWCRGGRGRGRGRASYVYYTEYSEGIRINGILANRAVVTLQPNWSEIFSGESITLTCEIQDEEDSEWKIEWKHNDSGKESSTNELIIESARESHSGDYRCKGRKSSVKSTEWSDPVKITVSNKTNITLRSPVHPVTEGDPVSLSCRLQRNHQFVSNVIFYQNDKVVQNDTSRDFNISAVSRSHEGFYKCRHLNEESAQSWMSVKGVSTSESSSSFPVWAIVGIVCGIFCGILLIVLLLLCHCRPSKDSSSISCRPVQAETTNQGPATYQNQNQEGDYSTLLHGDTSVYETIKTNDRQNDDYQNADYSSIELQAM
ncbi:uncharacterized protein V6R79_002675 [Siganus canaliculatus]